MPKSFWKPNDVFTFLKQYNTSIIETFIICKSFALGTVPGTRAIKITYKIINWEKRTIAHLAISYLLLIHKSSKKYSPTFTKITVVNRHSTTGSKNIGMKKKKKNQTQLLCLWAAPKWALSRLSTKEMHCSCQAGLPATRQVWHRTDVTH